MMEFALVIFVAFCLEELNEKLPFGSQHSQEAITFWHSCVHFGCFLAGTAAGYSWSLVEFAAGINGGGTFIAICSSISACNTYDWWQRTRSAYRSYRGAM